MLNQNEGKVSNSVEVRQKEQEQDHSPRLDPHFADDVKPHHHELRQEWRIYTMAVNACLGSWFFGYNLGVYNSAQKIIQKLNSWDDDTYTDNTALITAFMPLGALIGALFSRQIIDIIKGIRKAMMIFDVIAIIGTIVILVATTLPNLMIGRLICGFAIGTNTAIIPIYIKDFSPIEISGRAGAVNQCILTFGVFCSYIIAVVTPFPINIKVGYDDGLPWRIVLGLPILAPIIRLILLISIFRLETPTIMMKTHRYEEVHNFINKIYSSEKDADEIFHGLEEKVHDEEELQQKNKKKHSNQQTKEGAIQHQQLTSNHNQEELHLKDGPGSGNGSGQKAGSGNEINIQLATLPHETQQNAIEKVVLKTHDDFYHEKLFEISNKVSYLPRFIIGCFIQFGTQCSGVNAILFYSNAIFMQTAGGTGLSAEETGRYATIGLGGAMTCYTMLSFILLGKIGRRTMFLFGVMVCIIANFVFAGLNKAEQTKGVQNFSIFLIFLFQFGWQLSLGAVTWVYNSEIMDRFGISVSSYVRWTSAMIVGLVFPEMKKSLELFGSFLIFGAMISVVYILYIFLIKETRGKDRYQIAEAFISVKTYNLIKKEASDYADKAFEEQKRTHSES